MEFIGLALPVLVLILGGIYLPVLIDTKRRQAQSHGDDRFSANLRVLDTQARPEKRQPYSVNPPVLGGTMQRPVAPTQRDHSELMAARLTRARQIERRSQAARRRLTLLTVQFAVGMVLVTAGAVSVLAWWWSLIPLVTIAGTLALGARAAKAGRENDQRALEHIRALEARPVKGHRVSASEKKFAQMHTEAKSAGHSESAEKSTTSAQGATGELQEQEHENLGQQVLAKLAGAARRASKLRKYFEIHEDEAERQAEAGALNHPRENDADPAQQQIKATVENTSALASQDKDVVVTTEELKESSAQVEATEIIAENPGTDSADEAEASISSADETDSKNLVDTDRRWHPAPMPKPIYALKPRLTRRDVDASELLAEHLAARASVPYRPSRPRPHSEESLTTAQLVAQSKPVDVEAILNTRRIAN